MRWYKRDYTCPKCGKTLSVWSGTKQRMTAEFDEMILNHRQECWLTPLAPDSERALANSASPGDQPDTDSVAGSPAAGKA